MYFMALCTVYSPLLQTHKSWGVTVVIETWWTSSLPLQQLRNLITETIQALCSC